MTERPVDDDCIFCAIVAGDIPARTIFETDDLLAFLDANPLARGHTLVIPKGHYERVAELPPSIRDELFGAIGRLTPLIESVVKADATTIGINNGPVAGQEIPHVHGHIVPRFSGDGGKPIHAVAGDRPSLSDEELDDLADRLSLAAT